MQNFKSYFHENALTFFLALSEYKLVNHRKVHLKVKSINNFKIKKEKCRYL